jgi:hypothetical protein
MRTTWQMIGVISAILVLLAVSINATCMLISPRTWFELPAWVRLNGSLRKEKYGSGWAAGQVRIAGAIFLAMIGWLLFDMFTHR